MKYKCKCGNESIIVWGSFKNGNRCQKCAGNKKLTLDFVKEEFKKQNCELLETEYINAHTKIKYKCKCGNDMELFSTRY